MIIDMGKNISSALGGVFQTISGLGNALSQAGKSAKEAALTAQNISDAMSVWGVPTYRGKKKSLFRSHWGNEQYMKNRVFTVDGLCKQDFVFQPFTHTTTSSSSSTTSTM